jgi:hypothetical protein
MGYYVSKLHNGQVLLSYMNVESCQIEEDVDYAGESRSRAFIQTRYWLTEEDRREGLPPMYTERFKIDGELFDRYYGGQGSHVFEHWKEPHYYALDELPEFKEAEPAI